MENLKKLVEETEPSAEDVLKFLFSMNSTVYIQNCKLSENVLRRKYLEEQRTIREIADEFMCSKSKISHYLHLYGIKTRRLKNSELVVPRPAYGERRYGNKLVKNQKEQKVIGLMFNLARAGYSYRSIARTLNEMKIPTKTGVNGWNHKVVKNVMEREKEK